MNYWICDSQVKFTVEWEYLLYILTLTFTKCIPENSHLGNPPETTPTTLLHCQFVQHIRQWSKSLMPLMSTLKEILLEVKQSNYFQEANKAAKVSGVFWKYCCNPHVIWYPSVMLPGLLISLPVLLWIPQVQQRTPNNGILNRTWRWLTRPACSWRDWHRAGEPTETLLVLQEEQRAVRRV